jgi:hypothetical protein
LKLSTFVLLALSIGGWWVWSQSDIGYTLRSYVENGEILTLEARYSAEQLMRSYRKELLPGDKYSFREPALKFHPYLLMEVKYLLPNGKTEEGSILWSMVNGEMVLDTDTWQETHGFEDAITNRANSSDFQLMNVLAAHRGALSVPFLQRELKVDANTMNTMLQAAEKKHFVVMRGKEAVLHFQNPYFNVPPRTNITQSLVTRPYTRAERVSRRYTRSQIEQTALAAFGNDFAIRNSKEVFVPVYSIEVQNPDGTVLTSYWNAITGMSSSRE